MTVPARAAAQVGALAGHVSRLLPMVKMDPLSLVVKTDGSNGLIGMALVGVAGGATTSSDEHAEQRERERSSAPTGGSTHELIVSRNGGSSAASTCGPAGA